MNENPQLGALLHALQGQHPGQSFSSAELETARKFGLLSRLTCCSADSDDVFSDLISRYRKQLDDINDFDAQAKSLSLPYAVIKGIPLSILLYGTAWARASSDIDILVLERDYPKAHAAALKAGFTQPTEVYRARQLAAFGELDAVLLKGIASSYPVRTSPRAPHLSPYLKIDDDGRLTVLEIHTSCYGLPQELASLLVTTASLQKIGGAALPVPTAPFAFTILALAAHEACEGFRANTQPSILGMHYLLDLHKWLQIGAPLKEVSNFAFTYGLTRKLGEVFYDLVQIFSDDSCILDAFFPLYESPWELPYLKRLVSPRLRQKNAVKLLNNAIETMQDDDDEELIWPNLKCYEPLARSKVLCSDTQTTVQWLIKEGACKVTLPDLLFDVVILESFNVNMNKVKSIGKGYTLYNENGKWLLKQRVADERTLDGHVAKRWGEFVTKRLDISRRGDYTRIAFSIPKRAKECCTDSQAFFSIHRHEIAGIYHRIAGKSPTQTLMHIINNGFRKNEGRHAD